MKKLLLEAQPETDDLATLAADAVRKFEEHPDRRVLREREAKLSGDLASLERELAGLSGAPIEEDPAEALAAGREPVRPDWHMHHARRADLEQQRSLVRRALEMVARRQGETDALVTREVLSALVAPWGRAVAAQALRVRDVATGCTLGTGQQARTTANAPPSCDDRAGRRAAVDLPALRGAARICCSQGRTSS